VKHVNIECPIYDIECILVCVYFAQACFGWSYRKRI